MDGYKIQIEREFFVPFALSVGILPPNETVVNIKFLRIASVWYIFREEIFTFIVTLWLKERKTPQIEKEN